MTPMMEQWMQLKAQAGDSFLFFRLGDFYELFEEDAVRAAPIMGVTLTSRNSKSQGENAPALCGVPAANFELYLNRLLDQGHSVALAEQVEEPKPGKKIVRREIVQFFTPGIRLLERTEAPHYAGLVLGREDSWVLAAADVSTGHLVLEKGKSWENLQDILDRLPIEDLRTGYGDNIPVLCKYQRACNFISEAEARQRVLEALQLVEIEDAPCNQLQDWIALGTLLRLLQEAHPGRRLVFSKPDSIPNAVQMSAATRRHLHLFEPQDHSLFHILDECCTAVGRRTLKFLLSYPTQDQLEVQSRQAVVRFWKERTWHRKQLRQELTKAHDIQRILRFKKHPQRLFQLSESLKSLKKVSELLEQELPLFQEFQSNLKKIDKLIEELSDKIQWSELDDRGWIASGVNPEIDELRNLQSNAENLLAELESKLRRDLEVGSLKIRFHQVFGYIAEVTRQHQSKIPSSARQIQSLANAIRFKTQELEELEVKLLSLESRLVQAERAQVEQIYERVEAFSGTLMKISDLLGRIDCFQAFAEVSSRENWTTPILSNSKNLELRAQKAKHPLMFGDFVPLSFHLDQQMTRLMLLTGPNMAGKSTVLRVAAILALLHQIGSDVPAEEVELSIFDRIMCRMGAMDDLTQGKSTFFVEMKEVASMLYAASDKSLLLFDEIGRGTSTFDGMSLAWAITEAVHDLKCLSMIATHYLELASLENTLAHLKNFHLGVTEVEGQLLFTRRLQAGPASQSYGIQVARLASLPESILARAEQKLREFERKPKSSLSRTPLFEWMRESARV